MKKFWEKNFWVKSSEQNNPKVNQFTGIVPNPVIKLRSGTDPVPIINIHSSLSASQYTNLIYYQILSSQFLGQGGYRNITWGSFDRKTENKQRPIRKTYTRMNDEFHKGDEIEFNNGEITGFIVEKREGSSQEHLIEVTSSKDEAWERDEDVPEGYLSRATNTYWFLYTEEIKLIKPATPPKPIEVDLTHLEPLIIKEESKKQIMSVLKQHNHQKKIFEEWGLGEVLDYGKGMTLLFYGSPGTGKTRAAGCIAKACGTTLLTIGAAEIQTSEPGGANRNIQEAFANAKKEKKVLFLDECDSLITNRKEVGMVLGSEINTLLTEIERFEGVCILATNMIEHLDEALERRISLIVEFPKPDYTDRVQIWETLIPKKMPLDEKFKIKDIAAYALTGGQIKNAILSAARFAASEEQKTVTHEHFEGAIKTMLKSTGLMGKERRQTVHMDVERGAAGDKKREKIPVTSKTNA